MILVGTIYENGSAVAVYADEPITPTDLIEQYATECANGLLFDARVRLVRVEETPAPKVIAEDISESVHDKGE